MSKHVSLLPVLFAMAGLAACGGGALPSGTWSGVATPPDGRSIALGFEVSGSADSLSIVVLSPPEGQDETARFPASEVRLRGDTLSFEWTPRMRARCKLARQKDRTWEGTCVDDFGMQGGLTMTPPEH
ncbi:MAG: hypothetical protein ACE5HQ_04170 [Gemmatimonadota bacterium]